MSRECQTGSFEEFLDPGQALEAIHDRKVLERSSCIDPEANNITTLLRTIVRQQYITDTKTLEHVCAMYMH